MKIAVYTGTFNPLHIGHLAILRYLTEKTDFDMTYLVVSPQSPFKLHMEAESGRERYLAAVRALERHPEVRAEADDIELNMPSPQYTVRTLDALQAREPENTFTLIMGADNLASFDGWRDWQRILTDYGIAVYPREGYDIAAAVARLRSAARSGTEAAPGTESRSGTTVESGTESQSEGEFKIQIIDAPEVTVSSTQIREALAQGRDVSAWLM